MECKILFLSGRYQGPVLLCFIVRIYFLVVQSLSHVQLFATPWTVARQASLSITNAGSLLKLMSIESVMPSNHLIFCCPVLLLPSIFSSIRVFYNELVFCIRWPKYWSFSFSISPSNEYSGLTSLRIDLVWSPCCPRDSRESSQPPQFKWQAIPVFLLEEPHEQYDSLQTVINYWEADLPGGPGVKTELPVQGAQVWTLVRQLDPTCHN